MTSETGEGDGSFQHELSADLSLFLNLTVDVGATTSTPKATRNKNAPARYNPYPSQFKKPKRPPPQRGPVLATCKLCGAEYRTLRYYNKHMQGHTLKDLATRVPDTEAIKEKCLEIGAKTLEVMQSKTSVGRFAAQYQELLSKIPEKNNSDEWKSCISFLCDHFCQLLSKEKFCMPSALILSSLKITDEILTSIEDREYLLNALQNIAECSDKVLHSFICEFVLTFADQLVVFICRCLRNADAIRPINNVVTFDTEERQCIFYIGGSIIHGFLQMGRRYSKSKKWQLIVQIINSRILEDEFYENLSQQVKEDRAWTEKRNRGGLKFVKGSTQEFLLSVATIVAAHESLVDGSLPVQEILQKIVVGEPRYLWDRVVENSLDQDLSLTLMTGIAKSLISTYGKGIIKKHMNAINNNKASVSISLRHKVAPH